MRHAHCPAEIHGMQYTDTECNERHHQTPLHSSMHACKGLPANVSTHAGLTSLAIGARHSMPRRPAANCCNPRYRDKPQRPCTLPTHLISAHMQACPAWRAVHGIPCPADQLLQPQVLSYKTGKPHRPCVMTPYADSHTLIALTKSGSMFMASIRLGASTSTVASFVSRSTCTPLTWSMACTLHAQSSPVMFDVDATVGTFALGLQPTVQTTFSRQGAQHY